MLAGSSVSYSRGRLEGVKPSFVLVRALPHRSCRVRCTAEVASRSLSLGTSWLGSSSCCLSPALEDGRKGMSIRGSRRERQITRMGKKAQDGPFTPVVVLVRNQLGAKQFNQVRGKAISLHSQVIKEFGKSIGAESKQVQGLIRLAKLNGEKLGFLS